MAAELGYSKPSLCNYWFFSVECVFRTQNSKQAIVLGREIAEKAADISSLQFMLKYLSNFLEGEKEKDIMQFLVSVMVCLYTLVNQEFDFSGLFQCYWKQSCILSAVANPLIYPEQ